MVRASKSGVTPRPPSNFSQLYFFFVHVYVRDDMCDVVFIRLLMYFYLKPREACAP